MRASDVNIIPANYLRQENILTIVSSFFQDIHNNREPLAKPLAVAALSIRSILPSLAEPDDAQQPATESR
jgi:hypothetical protein